MDEGLVLPEPKFADFRQLIRDLPKGELDRKSVVARFTIASHGPLTVHYAPFEHINRAARVVFLGITPGWLQMRLALEAARKGLIQGLTDAEVLRRSKRKASFQGPMKTHLCTMLDQVGLPRLLGINGTEDLFVDGCDLLHATSALRYPVMRSGENYTGHTPRLLSCAFLEQQVYRRLLPELNEVPQAAIMPLGACADAVVERLVKDGHLPAYRRIRGLPHPSGANGWRVRKFAEAREQIERDLLAYFSRS